MAATGASRDGVSNQTHHGTAYPHASAVWPGQAAGCPGRRTIAGSTGSFAPLHGLHSGEIAPHEGSQLTTMAAASLVGHGSSQGFGPDVPPPNGLPLPAPPGCPPAPPIAPPAPATAPPAPAMVPPEPASPPPATPPCPAGFPPAPAIPLIAPPAADGPPPAPAAPAFPPALPAMAPALPAPPAETPPPPAPPPP